MLHFPHGLSAGLKYECGRERVRGEGVKVSGAVGRGNDRTIANAGVAWKF